MGFPPPTEERPGPEGAEGDEIDHGITKGAKSSTSTAAARGPTDATAVKTVELPLKSNRGDQDSEGESHDEEQREIFRSYTTTVGD